MVKNPPDIEYWTCSSCDFECREFHIFQTQPESYECQTCKNWATNQQRC